MEDYGSQLLLVNAVKETAWHMLELVKQFWDEKKNSDVRQRRIAAMQGGSAAGSVVNDAPSRAVRRVRLFFMAVRFVVI